MIHPDGAVETGNYKDDEWEGDVEITTAENDIYTALFTNGKQVGDPKRKSEE